MDQIDDRNEAATIAGLLEELSFDGRRYVDAHSDLVAAHLDAEAGRRHFVEWGLAEGRPAFFSVPFGQVLSRIQSAALDGSRREALSRSAAAPLCPPGPGDDSQTERAGALLDNEGAYTPLVVAGDSHSQFYYAAGLTGDVLPIRLLCSGGSARGLGNSRSRSGYGDHIRGFVDDYRQAFTGEAPGRRARLLLLFGQVDVEFVYDFSRVRRGQLAFNPVDFAEFAQSSVERYCDFIESLAMDLPAGAVSVSSVFPPALNDEMVRSGYVNPHINGINTDLQDEQLSAELRRLEMPMLKTRVLMHVLFNRELQIQAERAGAVFVDAFSKLMSSEGFAPPECVGAPAGADHHLELTNPHVQAIARGLLVDLRRLWGDLP